MPNDTACPARLRGLLDRTYKALVEYDNTLCLHAKMIAGRDRFTRADGWDAVERLREQHGIRDIEAEYDALAAVPRSTPDESDARLREALEKMQTERDALALRLRGADRMADEAERLIVRRALDARSPLGDALLDYRQDAESYAAVPRSGGEPTTGKCPAVNRDGYDCELVPGHDADHRALIGARDERGDVPEVRWRESDGEACARCHGRGTITGLIDGRALGEKPCPACRASAQRGATSEEGR